MRAWRHAAVYDGGRRASVATWLLTITRNLAIDAVRVERVRPADPVDVVDLTVVDAGAGPADIATRTTEVERVMGALLQLPVDQRRAVVLASVHGRTALEISEIERIPLGTAKTTRGTGLLEAAGRVRARGGAWERTACDVQALTPEAAPADCSGTRTLVVLNHLDGCEQCRELMHELSAVADELVLLAPNAEPPAGFEQRVLTGSRCQGRDNRRWPVVVGTIAAALLVVAGFTVGRVHRGGSLQWYTRRMRAPSGRAVGDALTCTATTRRGCSSRCPGGPTRRPSTDCG